MEFLPISWRLQGKQALLVGGGEVALRKGRLLHRSGAILDVVAPEVCDELRQIVADSGGQLLLRPFKDADLDGCGLVICATDDSVVNAHIADLAGARNVPVNVVDNPSLGDFIFPAIVDRSPVLISISSSGASPVLARKLRSQLESSLPARWGKLADLMARFRQPLKDKLDNVGARRLFWEQALDSPIVEKVLAGKDSEAEVLLAEAIADADADKLSRGEVYLVGAGPGDPDLLTFRALRLLQKADVVLYDRLVGKGIVDLARRDAELVYVGKARDKHALPQDNINELLVHYAKQGKKVCRLKGGDPFIFGRGGEEIDLIVQEGIDFQVVPGITAASGCAAYGGIPLTHRDHAQSVRFVTGHRKDGTVTLDWEHLVSETETVVFYMGLVGLRQICEQLMAHGRKGDTPIALVSRGTTDLQEVITGTLETLADDIEGREIHAPTLIIVGSVVSLHPKFGWFKKSNE
ncbi:uroporphyrin-III C-methyltransferase [Alcanivorax nanhaiticus]|uniref:Siroheme synthase n=1 Tax=Alcanivorax nanhaiticus TaxID=1177154 RepID=A0A095TTZ3_9GAMM|nr:siroheme synthase CysG [Alcanivorax nanhaiticus]KGD65878.1 uroporphyrin-III C-methyltransferase [Alcanivorax nanhaiticus]